MGKLKAMDVKKQTSLELGLAETELDYISDDLMSDYEVALEEKTDGTEEKVELTVGDVNIALAGVYCNSVTYDPGHGGYIRYKRGKKGTPNYGCGTESWRKSKPGTTVKQIGNCSGGRKKYLVSW